MVCFRGIHNGQTRRILPKLIIHSEERGIFDIDQINSNLLSGAHTNIGLLADFKRFYRYMYLDQQGQNKEVGRSETVRFRHAPYRCRRPIRARNPPFTGCLYFD